MSQGADDPNANALIGLWDFLKGAEKADTGLADNVAQNGQPFGDAFIQDETLQLDGKKDYFVTSGDDDPFDIDQGTVVITFSQGKQPQKAADILINRGEFNDRMKDGYFAMGVTGDGRVEVTHTSDDADLFLRTPPGLFAEGDRVKVIYAWSSQAGGSLSVTNLDTGAQDRIEFDTQGLSFATVDDDGENFTFGAREVNDNANAYSKFLDGSIESVAVYNQDIINTPQSDGIVSGTDGADLIDLNYIGDPDGDRIDAGDALLQGEAPQDDIVLAGDGDDTVRAGLGDDDVFAADGDDLVEGGAGNDRLLGEDGDDTLLGGDGNDTLWGGDGEDSLIGGAGDDDISGGDGDDTISGAGGGEDTFKGGDDRDLFTNVGPGDKVDGGSGGDDFDTLDLSRPQGSGPFAVEFTSEDKEDGVVTYFDDEFNVIGTLEFHDIENVVRVRPPICFTPGTMIATPTGERAVEDLRQGDRVITRDNGIQEICWVGARAMTGTELSRNPHLKPIRIRAGALGPGMPEQDISLSPNHRVLVANDKTALYFEEREVLVAAKHLTALEGIDIVSPRWITYIHIMFEQHEVVLSQGAWSESFQPGDYSLQGIGNAQRLEIQHLFPDLKTDAGLASYQAARRSLKRYEAKLLLKN
ncbi:MAG: Hint domain-containing protein [Roseobacter sp.]